MSRLRPEDLARAQRLRPLRALDPRIPTDQLNAAEREERRDLEDEWREEPDHDPDSEQS